MGRLRSAGVARRARRGRGDTVQRNEASPVVAREWGGYVHRNCRANGLALFRWPVATRVRRDGRLTPLDWTGHDVATGIGNGSRASARRRSARQLRKSVRCWLGGPPGGVLGSGAPERGRLQTQARPPPGTPGRASRPGAWPAMTRRRRVPAPAAPPRGGQDAEECLLRARDCRRARS